MTPEQVLEHLLNMSRDAARPHAFHHTSDVAVQLLRSRLAELEAEVKRLTELLPVPNISPE